MSGSSPTQINPWEEKQGLIFRPDVAEKLGAHRINDPVMASLVLEQLRLWELADYGYKDEQGNLWQLPTAEDWEKTSGRTFSPWRVRDVLSKLEQLGYLIREKFCFLSDILVNSPLLRGDNHTKMLRLNWERLANLWGGEDEDSAESVEAISSDGYRSDQRSDQRSDPDLNQLEIRSEQPLPGNGIEEIAALLVEEQLPDEVSQLITETRGIVGKMTPQLQKLILETQPEIYRTALSRYPLDREVKKPCSYLMKVIEQIIKSEPPRPVKNIDEASMREWFKQACADGKVLHEEWEFSHLPKSGGQVQCRVPARPISPLHAPFEFRPLVELMRS